MGALSHLRVLDLSRVLAGPWASQTLGDLGAEVIKVERPESGDDTRSWGPPWFGESKNADQRQSAYFAGANRNKQSVAIDISDARGQDLVKALAAKCDILIENFKVDGLRQYGLDYPSLRAINPALVYCSITGFGQTGPYAHRPGYDFLIQGMGGLMSVTGRGEGEPGAGPLKVGVALTDILTGLYATVGILAALAHRDRTGEGQHIDVALLDVQVACLANQAMNYLATGQQPPRMGNSHPNIVPYQDFRTSDGHIIVTVGNDGQFVRLCELLGQPDWSRDERFSTNSARLENRAVLVSQIQDILIGRRSAEWLADMEARAVPCGPINEMRAVFEDPQVRHRGVNVEIPTGAATVSAVANPLKLSATPVEYRVGPPALGADTEEVLLRLLDVNHAHLQALNEEGVIRAPAAKASPP